MPSRDGRPAWLRSLLEWNLLLPAYGVLGFGVLLLYAVGPLGATAHAAEYTAVGMLAVAAGAVGATRQPPRQAAPWLCLTAGLALLVAGDAVYNISSLLGHTPATPSVPDWLYFAGYAFATAGLVVLLRRSHAVAGAATITDGLVVTLAFGTVIAAPLTGVFTEWGSHPLSERLVLAAYPTLDVLLLALLARFVLAHALRSAWVPLLAFGFGGLLLADLVWVNNPTGYALGEWADYGWLVGYLLWGAAALHPSVRDRTEGGKLERSAPYHRFVILAVPATTFAVLMALEAAVGHHVDTDEGVATSVLLLLLLARLGISTHRLDEVVRRLSRSEERFRRVFADAPAGMALVGVDGRIVSTNAALAALARVDGSSIPGRRFLEFVWPEDTARYEQSFATLLGDGFVGPVERRFRADDGSEVWVLMSASLLADDRDPLVVVQLQDVSESRRLAAELAVRNGQLEEADRLKDELISVVSHDLRTPLTSIIGYLELATADDGGELSDERRGYLDVVQRNAHRLHRLVEDLLFVSRAEAGTVHLDVEPVDLTRLVRDAVDAAIPSAGAGAVELAWHGQDGAVVGDPHRLAEMIENLVSNAVKFTPEGGRVDVDVESRPDCVVVRVRDTGPGLTELEQARIFDRFFRGERAEGLPGAGLGLSIVKAIVDAHGGTIRVQSASGAGATFEVELPRSGPVAAAAAA